jgi:hypothetical protein
MGSLFKDAGGVVGGGMVLYASGFDFPLPTSHL